MRVKDLPDWVLKHKVKGTEVHQSGNNYYLYKIHCERVDGKNKKITDSYLGKITASGLIPPKDKSVKIFANAFTLEYGLSFLMVTLCFNLYLGLLRTDKRVANKIFVRSIIEFLYGGFEPIFYQSSALSVFFPALDFSRPLTKNMRVNIDRTIRMIHSYILKHLNSDDFVNVKNILSTYHIIKTDSAIVFPALSDQFELIYQKMGISYKEIKGEIKHEDKQFYS